MAYAGAITRPKPVKWVLAHDHGFHAITRAREFWHYRRLIWFFAKQAFQVLWVKTHLGWLWVPIRQLTPILFGAVVYGSVMNIPSMGVPYLLLLVVSSLSWDCFDGPWLWGSRGIDLNRHLVTKLYFPRMILPLASMSPGLAGPLCTICFLTALLPYYRITTGVWYVQLTPGLLLAPFILVASLFLAFSLSLWTSLWLAQARDARYALNYFMGFWMYLTPVIYPISLVPAEYRWLMWLNPMAPIVEAFKASMFGWDWPPAWAAAAALGESVVLFALGFRYFHTREAAATDKL